MVVVFVNPKDYPKSDIFIREMAAESVERILNSGWLIDKTLFFDIPYCAVTGAGSGIARDYQHQVYYRYFYATEGVISALTNLQLGVATDHEQDEIGQIEENAIEDLIKAPFTTLDEEIERHKTEMRPIEMRYGKDVVDGTCRRVEELSSSKITVPRYVLWFWFAYYFLNRFEQFKLHSVQMTPSMLSQKQRSFFVQTLDKVKNEYGSDCLWKEYSQLYLSAMV